MVSGAKKDQHSSQSGAVLMYIVGTMVILAVLGAAMVSFFGAGTTQTASPNCRERARFVAEGGLRYIVSQLNSTNWENLNNTQFNIPDAGNFSVIVAKGTGSSNAWDLNVTGRGCNEALVALHAFVSINATNGTVPPTGADISYPENMPEFDHVIESDNNIVNVDEQNKTVTIGGSQSLQSGCIWYGQDTGPCIDGVCQLGSGFRSFFRFRSLETDTSADSTEYASGFTFTITSDTESPPETVCGGIGAHLGYAGTQPDYMSPWGVDYYLGYPKMGVEVDYYPSDYGDCWRPRRPRCSNKEDGANNHVAGLFWGIHDDECLNDCSPWDQGDYGDDNRHGAGQEYGRWGEDSLNPDEYTVGYADTANPVWLEDGETHALRIDVAYNSTTGQATLQAWVDKGGSDLTSAMTAAPDIQTDIDSNYFANEMQEIRFGWTFGSSEGQSVLLSDFGIDFLDYEPPN